MLAKGCFLMLCCWCNGMHIVFFVYYSCLLQLWGTFFFIDSPKILLNFGGDDHVLCTSCHFFPLLRSYCFEHFFLIAQLPLPMKFWVDGVSSIVWDEILCGVWLLNQFTHPLGASQVSQWWRTHLPLQEMQETPVWSLGREDALE